MKTQTDRIVDIGRGPQIEGHWLTVLNVFYYLRRGRDFAYIHRAMPSLTSEQFDAVVVYVGQHHADLVEAGRRVEERNRKGIEEQKAKRLYHVIDHSIPHEQRIERLKERIREQIAERNGDHPPR